MNYDYYKKYLKYRQKYISLFNKLYGGGLEEYNGFLTPNDKIIDFKQYCGDIIGSGMEGKIYKINNYAYKVIIKRKINPEIFEKSVIESIIKYKRASELKLGPSFIGAYSTDKFYVIVMELIDGYNLEQISKMRDKLRIAEQIPTIHQLLEQKDELIEELKLNRLLLDSIMSDVHNANFMYRKTDGKLLAIDL
jgi:hypothetical protein